MNYLIVFVQLGILVPINADVHLKCPSAGQLRLRAQSYCPHEEMYTCLEFIDPDMPDEHKYIETCKGPRKESRGEKTVINSGNFDILDCSEDRYQPILFSTTKGSNCLLLKSNCNEEGQLIYSNGSTKQDRTCGCNYAEQYVFLSQNLNHPCYCIPSVEDCTCYKKACDSGFRLSPDYKCVPENETSERYNCKDIVTLDDDTQRSIIFNKHEKQTAHTISELDRSNVQTAMVFVGCIIASIGLSVIIVYTFKVRIDNTRKVDENKKAEYLDNMKTKTEKRFYIRVMIVGENGVGKSCLLRRLLGEGIEGVQSTDGIDIVVRRCKIRLSDGKWIFDGDQDLKRQYATRIKRALQQENIECEVKSIEMTTIDQKTSRGQTEDSSHEVQEEVQITVTAEDKQSGHQPETFASEQKTHNTQEHEKPIQPTESLMSTKKVEKVLIAKVEQELEHFLSRIEKYENENEVYVEIGFGDFAGEKDYYGTHHTFLDSHALYLLVTDCSQNITQREPRVTYDSIGNYIDFWFDTIHNCRDVEEENNDEHIDPPIIAVCTGLDKVTGKVEEKKESYLLKLKVAIGDGQNINHLRDVRFVSNTKQSGSDFDHVRKLIFDFGKKLQSFGKELPLEWIRLEQSLDVVREGGYNVIAREDVIDLAKKCDIDGTEEVEQFLKHQHKMGSIIYCEDIQNYVILKQQWLADALKCLVSDKIDNIIKISNEWETLLKTGILDISLITKLFQKEQKLEFSKYEEHILQVLNKFDIVGIHFEQGKAIYYMPYMIKPEFSPSLSEIVDHFGVSNAQCRKTPWLCYAFDFFPLPFFTYVMLYFIRSYKMCFDSKLNKRSIYHGVGVFFLDQTRDHKFIVLFCKNTVAFQIWHWEDFPKERYQTILIEFQKVIDNLKTKYEARNLRYYVKVKCSEGDVNSKVGRMSYRYILESNSGKYFCDEHNCKHDSSQLLDTWFYNFSNLPIRFHQRCIACNSKPSVCWCYECKTSFCDNCSSQHLISEVHHVQHVQDKYTLDYTFNVNVGEISDIKLVNDRLLCISKYLGKGLVTVYITDRRQQYIPLAASPYCITVVDNSTVAVTLFDSTEVLMVEIGQGLIVTRFDVKESRLGIMYSNNQLFVGCNENTIKVLSMSGEITRTIPLNFSPNIICGSVDGRIYCTDWYNLYCIDTEGKLLFTFTHPDMDRPMGITTDDTGHVLVVCNNSGNILSISPNGKHCQVIVKHVLSRGLLPNVCYIPQSKSLVVSIYNSIDVYKLRNID